MAGLLERFRPCDYSLSVMDIDVPALVSGGLDCLMLDLDNTLLPCKSSVVPEDVRQWIEGAKSAGMKVVIVSNTHNPRRLSKIAAELDVPSVFRALKPRRSGFARAADMVGSDVSRSAVVGDQILTDILGGNLSGMHTILVKPMHSYEFFGTKISRAIEWMLLAALGRQARSGTKCG